MKRKVLEAKPRAHERVLGEHPLISAASLAGTYYDREVRGGGTDAAQGACGADAGAHILHLDNGFCHGSEKINSYVGHLLWHFDLRRLAVGAADEIAPHLPVGILEVVRRPGAVHEWGRHYPLPHRCSHFA